MYKYMHVPVHTYMPIHTYPNYPHMYETHDAYIVCMCEIRFEKNKKEAWKLRVHGPAVSSHKIAEWKNLFRPAISSQVR
jgi:hypothetical protein